VPPDYELRDGATIKCTVDNAPASCSAQDSTVTLLNPEEISLSTQYTIEIEGNPDEVFTRPNVGRFYFLF